MRASLCILLLTGTLSLTSCDGRAIDASKSLVGAKKLPSAKTLSQETIVIDRNGGGRWGKLNPGRLDYELKPDGTLTVTLERYDWDSGKASLDGKETFRLSSDLASRTRKALWRMRPAELRGIQWDTEVSDCPPPPTDNFPDYAVAAGDTKSGVDNHAIGVSVLRGVHTCNSPKSAQARAVIEGVLKSFPASRVAAEHSRRMKSLEAKPHS